ncbi:MAG: radical SAM/SPASM domain-containing protein [Planctomycetota bacterium]|jgi:radical SAM protein with 4Fe4S-binding SPASM domain
MYDILEVLQKIIPCRFVARRNAEAMISQRSLREVYNTEDVLKLLKTVHIETRTRCNSKCVFCAANPSTDPRPDSYMPVETYHKIIDGLAEFNYENRVSPYCNNEPLMDDRIYDFVKHAKERLPQATIELKTNGILLDLEILDKLFDSGLDLLFISDYENSKKSSENLKKLYADNNDRYSGKIIYGHGTYYSNEGKVNRAGTNPAMPDTKPLINCFCYRPFEMLTFTADGRAAACSNDLFFENTMGNVNECTVKEIFNGESFQKLRKDVLEYNRTNWQACSKCDYLGLTNKYNYRCLFKPLL